MGYWIFMLISDLLIPLVMVLFGIRFRRNAPRQINCFLGYRTTRSMKNRKTWEFAHRHFGKVWMIVGLCLLPVTVAVMLMVLGQPEERINVVGLILCGVQLAVLLLSLIPTELALKRKFDI